MHVAMAQELFRKTVRSSAQLFGRRLAGQPAWLWILMASTASVALAADLFLVLGTYLAIPCRAGGRAVYRITLSLSKQAVTAYGKPEPLKPGMPWMRTFSARSVC